MNFKFFTIRKVGSNNEQKVEASAWATCKSVWLSQMCWYMPGTHAVVTNVETGESEEFVK